MANNRQYLIVVLYHPLPLCQFSQLFVSKFSVIFLLVGSLTKSLNCSVTFHPSYCVFQNLLMRKKIVWGHKGADGLYYLDVLRSKALSSVISPQQWHYRLGHPSLPKLCQIVPLNQSLVLSNCEACQLGKHHKSMFPMRVNKISTRLFELIHSDI